MLNHDAIVQAMLRLNYAQGYMLKQRGNLAWESLSQEEKLRRAEQYADAEIAFRAKGERECA